MGMAAQRAPVGARSLRPPQKFGKIALTEFHLFPIVRVTFIVIFLLNDLIKSL